jgi:CubicO group peptidase (beta-lactamase class C family)
MARFGYLYLNNGTWNGTKVISSEWVNVSTQMYFDTGSWYHYGYTWWGVPEQPFYEATGHYEQKIFVLPEHDIVCVFTGDIADEDWHPTDYFVMEYVLNAGAGENARTNNLLVVNVSIVILLAAPIPYMIVRLKMRK